MIKNLTKLGCHLVCCTYYLKIAHYLPHLIFLELTSLCGNWSSDQRTHLFGILSHVGVLMAGVAFFPFLFVMNHHLPAASGEAGLVEVTSVISMAIVPSVTLATGTQGTRLQKAEGGVSPTFAPYQQPAAKASLPFFLSCDVSCRCLPATPGQHTPPGEHCVRCPTAVSSPSLPGRSGTPRAQL